VRWKNRLRLRQGCLNNPQISQIYADYVGEAYWDLDTAQPWHGRMKRGIKGTKMQPEGLPQNSPGQRPGVMDLPLVPQPEGLPQNVRESNFVAEKCCRNLG
jgi:hypothetical protein